MKNSFCYLQILKPGCPTKSCQSSYNVNGGPLLQPQNGTNGVFGFCQSSQPLWSAHRDPSFGHGILKLLSAEFSWYVCILGIYCMKSMHNYVAVDIGSIFSRMAAQFKNQ